MLWLLQPHVDSDIDEDYPNINGDSDEDYTNADGDQLQLHVHFHCILKPFCQAVQILLPPSDKFTIPPL